MRIAFVGPFGLRPKGTMSMRALPLARALAAKGHEVILLIPPWDWPADSGRSWDDQGVRVENVLLPPKRPLVRHGQITARLLQRLRKFRPDVVHCFKPKAYAGLVAWAIWWLRKANLVSPCLLAVDADDWEGAGGWNQMGRYSPLERCFFAWQERWGLRHCDLLTVASEALQTIVWSMGVSPDRVLYLPNGVDAQQTGRAAARLEREPIRRKLGLGDERVVLVYTRFLECKVRDMVEVLQRIRAALPRVRFWVVGKGFAGEEEEMLRLADERSLSSQLTYMGWVPQEHLAEYFAVADVAIFPLEDTLINRTRCSVKLLDLLAAGVPVIATQVGQNAAYIQHGSTGLLVPAGEVERFVEATVHLLQEDELRGRMGTQAREWLSAHYSWERLAERVERAYEASLGASRPA